MDLDQLARQYGGAPSSASPTSGGTATGLDELAKQFGGVRGKSSTERTFGEAAVDVPAGLISGLGSLLQFPGQIVKFIPGLRPVGEFLEIPGEFVSKGGDYLKSEGLKARERLQNEQLTEAEKDGILAQFATAITSTIKDPALLTNFVTQQVPLLLGPGLAVRLTHKLGASALESAATGLTGKAAEEAIKTAADRLAKRGYAAAYGTGSAMQAADVASDTYDEALRKAREMGLPEDEAISRALNAGRIAGVGAGVTSLLAQRLPGAKAIEQRLAKVPGTTGRLGSAAGESLSEAIEEGGGQVFKNLGIRQVDPEQPLMQGVGGAAGMGALGGGLIGGALGKKGEEPRMEGQLQGESLYQTAQRLSREISSIDALSKLTEQDQVRQSLGLKTNVELVDMYRTEGYGSVKKYQQELLNIAQSPQTSPEQKAEATQMAQDIQSFLTQATEEEVKRKAPTITKNVMSDQDVAVNLGIPRKDPLYKELVGKDLGKPEDAEAAIKAIQGAMERKGLRQTQYTRFATALDTVNEYLSTIPGSGFYAGQPVTEPTGEGAGVAGVPPAGAPAPGVAEPERVGVVPPAPPAGQVVGGEAVQPPALAPTPPLTVEPPAAPVAEAPAAVEPPAEAPVEAPVAAPVVEQPRGLFAPPQSELPPLPAKPAEEAPKEEPAKTQLALPAPKTGVPVDVSPKIWDLHTRLDTIDRQLKGELPMPLLSDGRAQTPSVLRGVRTRLFKTFNTAVKAQVGEQQAADYMGRLNTITGIRRAIADGDQQALDTYRTSAPDIYEQEVGEAPKALAKPEGEVIDVEARVVEETLGPKVNALPAPQVTALEKHYGVSKDSPTFLQRVKEDVVLYATKGGKAVAATIRPIIRKLHAAVLAAAVIFNPTNISPAEAVIFDKQVITETREIRVAPPESVASKMSDGAKEAYSILYPSIKDQLQRDNKLMLIVDKPKARMFVFTPDGQPLLDKKVLLGKATGDLYKGNNDLPQNRVTPAGLFKMGLRDADRSIGEAKTAGEYDFKKVFVLDKAIEGEYSVTLFHSVWLKESDAALRAKALKSESETDSRYSFGCINVDKQTYERLITSHLNQMDGASLFIVPDNPAATAEFLTGATAKNVSGADGLTRTTFTPAKETVTLVKPVATPVKTAATPVKTAATPVKEAPAKLSIVKKGTEERAKEILERQAKQRTAPSAPEPGAKEQLAQRRAELVKQLDAVLNRILAKYNLKDVKLNLDEAFTEEGSYSQRIITMALNLDNPVRVLRHEAIHALKDMGFFTDNQWKVLEQRAKDQWIQVLKDSPHTETQSRYDAYIEIFKQEARQKGLTGDALDKYVETNVIEEAIADAFGDYDATKAPPGMMSAILERMRNLFRAIKEAFGIVGIETAEDIFGKIEKGQLKSVLPSDEKGVVKKSIERPEEWKATPQELRGADEYFEENGIMPYTSEGQITVPMDVEGTKFSIKKPYDQKKLDKDETLKNDPLTGLPMNLNGTVSLYYPTTNDLARQLATSKRLKGHSPEANRIYLTNESSAAAIENNPGMIDQPLGGANVLLQVDPSMLHLLEEYPDGRKDFFIPIAEGKAFAEKMAMTKLFTLNAPRTKGLHPDRTLSDVTKGVTKAVEDWQAASAAERREMARNAKAVLREQHNVEKLFGANAKLEKTNIGTHGLTYKGKKVMSTGLGFASAQKINDMQRASTCPQSAICEALCLGETSGQNRLYGGDGQFRSGPRLSQYLKTEALVVNPEAFTVSLIRQITAFRRAANEAGYQPAIRLNVTSDFNPKVFEAVINMFPDVMFYDYTKLETTPIAPNHHLTYSSTGATQVVNGEVIYNKYSNWDRMVDKVLPAGRNVAMAFSSRTSMPKFVVDERTKKRFEVWNGDEYDARFLDPAREDGVGLIIGLTNKDSTTNPEDAAKEHNGFFLDYDPQRDKDTLVIPNQTITEKVAPIKIKRGKMSLRPVEEMPNFKFWFGKSVVVDKDGNPKVMYHGTGKDYKIFTTKRRAANAIFLTDEPKFAEVFAKDSFGGAAADTARGIGIPANKFQIGVNKAVAAIRKDYGSRPEGKAMIEEVRKGYDNASPEAQGYMRQAFLDFVPTGPNIMPLYVRAEEPFDYDNKAHVEQVARTLADRSKGGEAAVQENIKKLSRGEFELVEAPDVQQAIRDLGFDGFYVKELGKKSLAVYSPEQVKSATGNVGAFGQRPITEEEADLAGLTKEEAAEAQAKGDIRFSLRAPQTKEFKQWFRKSKIVDADGNPEVMYHGTSADFTVPKTDTSSSGAFFVTKNPQTATNFAQLRTWELDGGANIMPLYVSAENPFDFENPKHLAKLLPKVRKVLRETEGYSPEQITDFVDLFKDGDWRAVEFINSFYLFHRNGFDAFYVKEGNEKNLALLSPNQVKSAIGNVGTFSFGSKDIRYSLRRSIASSMTPSMIASMNKIAPQTYKPNMVERILDTIAGDNHTRIRQAIVNRYERLAEYDRRVAAMLRQMGGIQQLADSKAETAALFSDLGAGILETALGAHDQFGGAPVFRNGITQVSNFGGAVKGPILIFKPLSDLNDPDVYRLYQTWSAVKRGVRLDEEGREQLIDAADVANTKAMEASHPNLKALFESVQKDWIVYNNALVKYAQDTGVITPEMAREYTKHGDYFPFYRLIDDSDVAGPKMFTSIGNVRPPKKLKGDESPLGDFFENIVRNSQAMIQAGIKNVAAQRATEQAMKLNEVTRLTAKSSVPSVYRVLENGKEVYYQSHDPLFIEAIKALNMPDLPFIGLLAGPANLLRNLVTKDPAFMLANMMRDSLSAYVTSGVNMMPMVDTFRNFGEALAGTSPEMQKLWAGGILGGYDYSRGAKVSAQEFERRLREVSGLKTTAEKIATPFTSLWGALEKGTQASDAATRIEVYRRTLAQTGNEAEAMWAALEVMNFNRKGNSAIVRILTAAVPFLNARMQGLDLLYRTAIMPALRSSTATEQEMSRMKTFWVRGMTIAALSTMYWWLTHDDDEYKKQEQEVRDNYWLIPSLGIKIPIPFEVGVIFKVLPERIAQLYVGKDTTKDFTDAMTRHFLSTFAFNPIFQTVLPIYEVKTNYSFFTQRPIIGKGLEDVAAPYQIGPSTSRVAEMIGKSVGYSPMKIDHLIKGYTGTIGGYMANVFDMIYDMNTNVPKASKRFEQMPVIRRFLIDPEARGKVTAYYQMKDSVDEVVRTSNLLERSQNYRAWGAYMQENFQMLAVKDYINDMEKTMKEYRDMKIEIMSAPISADAKRSMLTAIGRLENATVSNIQTLKKSAYR